MQTLASEPVQFSHKRYAALKLKCLSCHTPGASKKPVSRLPSFVFFSHSKHTAAKIQCETCHVQEPFLPMKMKACVDCHKISGAPVTCTTCHELSQ